MNASRSEDFTLILEELEGATRTESLERLFPIVYDELRALARARLRQERPGHTLEATAIVHEVYIRLIGSRDVGWNDSRHFFNAAALAMRRLLIDHARRRGQAKRGGARIQVTLPDVPGDSGLSVEDTLALDEAIQRLEGQDERMAEIVRLRFYAGLSVEETAGVLDISARTVKREWAVARAWLYDALSD